MLDLLMAVVGGAAAGGLAATLVNRRRELSTPSEPGPDVGLDDPVLEANIDGAARALARAQGRPGAERLIANKLKLAVRLRDRLSRERSR